MKRDIQKETTKVRIKNDISEYIWIYMSIHDYIWEYEIERRNERDAHTQRQTEIKKGGVNDNHWANKPNIDFQNIWQKY